MSVPALAMKWSSLLNLERPEELLQAVQEQQSECAKITAEKDKVIHVLQTEISKKDDEYTRSLLLQEKEIDNIIDTIRDQYATLIATREQELDDLETRLEEDRNKLRNDLHQEIESLLDKRRKLEESIMNKQNNTREDDFQMLKNLRIQQAEDTHSLRMRYWSDLQHQDREIEQMRATYLLNIERLEHNHASLTQQSLECEAQLTAQKRKQSKMRDVLSQLKKTYYQSELTWRTKSMRAMENFRRVTEDYKDLQNKLIHFERNDHQRFSDLFSHYDAKIRSLFDRCLDIDEFVFSDQLGLNYHRPSNPTPLLLDHEEKSSIKNDCDLIGGKKEEDSTEPLTDFYWIDMISVDEELHVLLNLIDQECKFLVPNFSESSTNSRLAVILGMLKIRNPKKLSNLMSFFKSHFSDLVNIDSSSVLSTLLSFFNDGDNSELYVTHRKGIRELIQSDSHSITSDRKKQSNIPNFNRIAESLPSNHVKLWKSLGNGLVQYKQVLTERLELLDRTDDLRSQNQELKQLVNNYLRSKINEELIVPPRNVLKM
ncbi:hypothetical protein RCL1_007063 [Eukaryota sp. TZLM3-RCL]